MATWNSEDIHVDGMTLRVEASAEAVISQRSVDGVYASDLSMQPDEACRYAAALVEAANRCRAARGEA